MVLISKGISTNTCTDKSPLQEDSKEEEVCVELECFVEYTIMIYTCN